MLILYGIHYHQRMIELTRITFSTALEGRTFAPDVTVSLDGRTIISGEKISLGNHVLRATHSKGDPVATKFFAWYGPHDFGQIQLKRTKGMLSVKADPRAESISISGPEFSATLKNCSATNLTVPTDTYTVKATYPHWSQSQDAPVANNLASAIMFAPQFGGLNLTCNHSGAAFQLRSADGEAVDGGNLPATVTDLPPGSYQITTSYHKLQLHQSMMVETGKTNEQEAVFKLGAARLESIPPGATVRDADGGYLGETPLSLSDITPHVMRLSLSLAEYQTTPAEMEIIENQITTNRINLVSLRYLSAIKNAHDFMASGNYADAVQATREALTAKADDADAVELQNQANTRLSAQRQREDEERERVARLKRPREVFDGICSKQPDASLFSEHEIKTSKNAREIKAAIVKSLQAEPTVFQIFYEDSPQTNVYQVSARHEFSLGILGGSVRVILLIIGQTKDDETQILFKVLEYQTQHTVVAEGLKFRDDKQLIPLHPSRIQMTDILQSQVQEGTRIVTEKVQQAIQQVQ